MRQTELSGRLAIGTVAALIGVMFMGSTLVTPLYVIYEQDFGFSRLTLTLVYAVYAVGNLAALLLFGGWSDDGGRRRVSLCALAAAGASTLCYLFAGGTAWLFCARALSGLAIALAAGAATAWIAELDAEQDKARATLVTTGSNFLGLAVGALAGGLLAEYAPWPKQLPFLVYLVLLLVIALLIARTHETVSSQRRSPSGRERPALRLGVPREIRRAFIAPGVSVFGTMALAGFYAALIPSVLAEELGEQSHALAGAIAFELAAVVAAVILVTRRLSSRSAMLWGLVLLLPGLALLVAAQLAASLPVLLVGTAVSGASIALGYRGSLQVVNRIAPDDRRAQVVSTYFVCGFSGNALPVIGVGALASVAGAPVASAAFAATIAALAVAALAVGTRYLPKETAELPSKERKARSSGRR
jgi:MFS family permease